MTQFVFFDIGDVLFDEDAQHLWLFHTLLMTLRTHGKNVEWDAWNETRRRLTAQGPNPEAAIKGALAAYCANETETDVLWHEARGLYEQMRKPRPYGFLLNNITQVLHDLRADFKLGIVANQHPPVAQAVETYGITPLFEVIVISEIVHLFKPDPAIFQYALDAAKITAQEAIFVGDRPDSDVRPAKSLGMKTVRFKRGIHYSDYNPDDPAQTADRTVTDVSQLTEAIRHLAAG